MSEKSESFGWTNTHIAVEDRALRKGRLVLAPRTHPCHAARAAAVVATVGKLSFALSSRYRRVLEDDRAFPLLAERQLVMLHRQGDGLRLLRRQRGQARVRQKGRGLRKRMGQRARVRVIVCTMYGARGVEREVSCLSPWINKRSTGLPGRPTRRIKTVYRGLPRSTVYPAVYGLPRSTAVHHSLPGRPVDSSPLRLECSSQIQYHLAA